MTLSFEIPFALCALYLAMATGSLVKLVMYGARGTKRLYALILPFCFLVTPIYARFAPRFRRIWDDGPRTAGAWLIATRFPAFVGVVAHLLADGHQHPFREATARFHAAVFEEHRADDIYMGGLHTSVLLTTTAHGVIEVEVGSVPDAVALIQALEQGDTISLAEYGELGFVQVLAMQVKAKTGTVLALPNFSAETAKP